MNFSALCATIAVASYITSIRTYALDSSIHQSCMVWINEIYVLLHVTHLLTRRLQPTSSNVEPLFVPAFSKHSQISTSIWGHCFHKKIARMLCAMFSKLKWNIYTKLWWYGGATICDRAGQRPCALLRYCVTDLRTAYTQMWTDWMSCATYTPATHITMYDCRNGRPEFALFLYLATRFYRIYFLLFDVCAL